MNEENLISALKLLVVGLATVFVALELIILLGNLLIRLVNKYAPEEEKPAKQSSSATPVAIDPTVIQAVNKAVEQITAGKGTVQKIERL